MLRICWNNDFCGEFYFYSPHPRISAVLQILHQYNSPYLQKLTPSKRRPNDNITQRGHKLTSHSISLVRSTTKTFSFGHFFFSSHKINRQGFPIFLIKSLKLVKSMCVLQCSGGFFFFFLS